MSQAGAIVEAVETRQEHPLDWTAELTSVRFAQVARQLAIETKRHGLRSPAFRSPPRVPGVTRSIRRRADGSATVSVLLRGRPAVAVVADMIDGVMAANEHSTRSAAVRDRLWSAATPLLSSETTAPVTAVASAAAVASATSAAGSADPRAGQNVDHKPSQKLRYREESPPARRAA